MRLAWLLVLGLITGFSGAAAAIDGVVPTITGPSDITSRRSSIATQVWGTSTLPTTQPVVVSPCTSNCNVFAGFNYSRIDQYVASMSNGQTNTSNLYIASPANGRVAILNPGHQGGCDWTAFTASYRLTTNPGMLQALLSAGYSVFAMNMPGCGDPTVHRNLYSSYGNAATAYFLEPAIQAMNYWDAHASFGRYDMVGLSGGSWTAALLSALDTRITVSVPVAGSWPGIIFAAGFGCAASANMAICGDGCTVVACAEQNWTNLFTIAGYIDLYVMAGYPTGRRQYQILNFSDDCCFGSSEYPGGAVSAYGAYPAFFANYVAAVKANTVVPNFDGAIDMVAASHQISVWAQPIVIAMLTGSYPFAAPRGGHR